MKKQKNNKLKKILSIMALLEVFVLIIAVTYSWTMDSKIQGKIKGNELEVILGGDIYATQDGNQINSISSKGITLAEVSSVDGRNFFFPLENNASSLTEYMKFREGTPSDVNTKYFQCDFELKALKDNVSVYLDVDIAQTDILVIAPIRVSVNYNDGKTPIVLSNTEGTFTAISAIDNIGTPTPENKSTVSFKEYTSKPLFTFSNNDDVKNITVTIWLEGTEIAPSNTNYIADQDLDVNIEFYTA